MVERTNREYMYILLENHPEWKVVDIASSNAGWKYANVFTDVRDHSVYYAKKYNGSKKFVKCNVEHTPFKDKEFDFVIASHILEHVPDPIRFCNELERIGKRGYIETPTPLWDNLVTGRRGGTYGHKWWITFNDVTKDIVYNKKINVVGKLLSTHEHNKYMAWFRESAVTQLYWEEEIDIYEGDGLYSYNDNRKVSITFDAKYWNDKNTFKFGKNG